MLATLSKTQKECGAPAVGPIVAKTAILALRRETKQSTDSLLSAGNIVFRSASSQLWQESSERIFTQYSSCLTSGGGTTNVATRGNGDAMAAVNRVT